jgi:hypothetical protein
MTYGRIDRIDRVQRVEDGDVQHRVRAREKHGRPERTGCADGGLQDAIPFDHDLGVLRRRPRGVRRHETDDNCDAQDPLSNSCAHVPSGALENVRVPDAVDDADEPARSGLGSRDGTRRIHEE